MLRVITALPAVCVELCSPSRERDAPHIRIASHNRFMVMVEADPRERLFPISRKQQQQQQKLFRVQATQPEEGNERAQGGGGGG